MINTAMAQNIQLDTLSKFKGTWAGSSMEISKGKEFTRVSYVIWRIHGINNLVNQIEVTEINQKVYTGEEIKDPVKTIYKGRVVGDSLFAEVEGPANKNKLLVKLGFGKTEGVDLLKGTVESTEPKDNFAFHMIRINDDISTYVKPKEFVEVIVTPPPPVKN
jgi:hypothetical protein